MPEGAVAISMQPVLIVDDDQRMRQRLRQLLAGVGAAVPEPAQAASIAGARERANATDFAAALVDIGLPDGNGVDLLAWLHARFPRMVLVVVSAYGDADTVLAALRAGAIGYLLKERDDAELAQALATIQRGGAPIDPFVARRILGTWTQPDVQPVSAAPESGTALTDAAGRCLTEREREILALVARGYSNREIAELMALSRFTIEDHTKRIYRKLAVNSRTAAVFEANNQGLLS